MNMKLLRNAKFPIDRLGEASGNTPSQPSARILDENTAISFPEGIPAFEDSKRFVLVMNENIMPFVYLRSLDIDNLGFICVDPFLVYPSYAIKLPAKSLDLLDLQRPEDALPLSFVTISPDPKETTANLMAPIIINIRNLRGGQIILEDFPVRHKIWSAIDQMQSNAAKEA